MLSAQLKSSRAQDRQADSALAIWSAGVESVLPVNVIPRSLAATGQGLIIGSRLLPVADFERVYVFGAGKAGAAMAVEVENALRGSRYWDGLRGRVNVPGSDVTLPQTNKIELQVARPAGHNLPTEAGRIATGLMIEDLGNLDQNTIALGLFSGGGSALMVQPREGVGLDQLVALTKFLQDAGATIHELNGVRSWLSQEKAGGLARLCNAGRIETLIISDVVGDDLGVIASGPCFASDVTARQAHDCLAHFVGAAQGNVPEGVTKSLQFIFKLADDGAVHPAPGGHVRNNLIATNAVATAAAQKKAEDLKYRVVMFGSTNQGDAYSGGRQFANLCQEFRERGGRWCVISGGEPTLVVNAKRPAGCRGGRNQAFALAALDELWNVRGVDLRGMAILAGGTDGEDGPCDVAGAVVTQEVLTAAHDQQLDLDGYLTNNDEYSFFERSGGHFTTGGGTNTNVADLRVACIDAE
jgi:hydroxypyruvate reductase